MPGYRYHTDLFFLLTLLKVRFEGKRDSKWKLKISNWKDIEKKTTLRPEKRFEANAH